MQLTDWIAQQGGIVHREDILRAGYSVAALRAEMRSDGVTVIRRAWLALSSAPPDLLTAARAGGRLACVSFARRQKWWLPVGIDERVHLRMAPKAGPVRLGKKWNGVLHWTKSIAPVASRSLCESPEDALAHIATCLPRDQALVLWESAIRVEGLSAEGLRQIRWPSRAASECAQSVTGLSDSGLETLLAMSLRSWGLEVRQQILIAGHRVDLLVGDRLVVQVDGYAHHSSSAQRTSDIAHDAELRLRGYAVLRFSYAQVVHDRRLVERTIRRAVAAGLHLAA